MIFPDPWEASQGDALGRVLRDRIRATDDAGLIGPWRLGVVLPETHADGAWKLAEDLCGLLPHDMARPQCEVYTYPTHPSNGEPQDVEANGKSVRNGRASNGHLEPAETNGNAPRAKNRQAVRPMETFFVRPLPGWKRALDVLGAGMATLLAAPLMLLVAAAIKLTSRGPVIFQQKRDTIGGRQFTVYKFRTMSVDAESQKAALIALSEQDGPAFKLAKDPRVTRLGRFLRVTSIDELPQLFNVLAGDMTLVGPRAMDSNESRQCETWQRRRLDVTAGITCIWQVRGRSSVSFAEWMRMDLSYIRSRSMANDLKLIAQTVPAVLLRRGAY
jgi:lipopolysaccharide/colanic/teichoic acid biosynthesis glycosyltransferase